MACIEICISPHDRFVLQLSDSWYRCQIWGFLVRALQHLLANKTLASYDQMFGQRKKIINYCKHGWLGRWYIPTCVKVKRVAPKYPTTIIICRQVALGGHSLCLAASEQRIFATSWHYLSKNSGRLHNFETSHLRDFGSLEYINTLSATSKLRIFVTSAL